MTVRTKRLILRPWDESDLESFAQLNAGPRVREHFPGILSREESDASAKLMSNHIERCGWGFWASFLIQTGEFIGFIGLEDVYFSVPSQTSRWSSIKKACSLSAQIKRVATTAEHVMKKYVFKPYSKIFPELFQKERISSNVNLRLVIEHIGSTAVPGLGGKGIIDIQNFCRL